MSSFLFKVFRQSHVTKTEDNTATTRSPISSRNNGLETVEGEWSNGSRCRDGQQQRQVPTRQDNNQTRDSRYSSKVYISSELRERGIRQEEPTGMAKVAEAENDSVDKESPCKHQQQNPPKQSEVIDLCSNDSDDDSVDYDRDNQCKRDGTQKASEDHSAGKLPFRESSAAKVPPSLTEMGLRPLAMASVPTDSDFRGQLLGVAVSAATRSSANLQMSSNDKSACENQEPGRRDAGSHVADDSPLTRRTLIRTAKLKAKSYYVDTDEELSVSSSEDEYKYEPSAQDDVPKKRSYSEMNDVIEDYLLESQEAYILNNFMEKYGALKVFKEAHGRLVSKQDAKRDAKLMSLYNWLCLQRLRLDYTNKKARNPNYVGKRYTPLSRYEFYKLKEIGYDFRIKMRFPRRRKCDRASTDQKWQDNFALLVQFKSKHGHLKVPSYGANQALYRWMRYQRHRYRASKDPNFGYATGTIKPLTDKEESKLRELGLELHEMSSMNSNSIL